MGQKYHQAILFGAILVFLTISWLGCRNSGEKQTDSTEEKVHITIAKEGFHVFRENMDGSISSQWLLSDSLSEHATIEEIEDLATTNDDPIMRLIAFRNHGDGVFDSFFPFIILLIDDIVVFLQKTSRCREKQEFTAPPEYTMSCFVE